ncbi:hypothetical protein LP420_36015 [Massilia sp. B-10]|nr:hypothetical protein LP420_36015 [Massilia sp. B-10]
MKASAAVQARTGETVIADHNGTVLSAQVIPGARFHQQTVHGGRGQRRSDGRVWSSVLFRPARLSAGR